MSSPMNSPPGAGDQPPMSPPPGGGPPPMDPAVLAALDHSRRTTVVYIVAIICIPLVTIAVGLRLYTRRFILKRVGADDYMAVAALVGVLAVAGTLLDHVNHGLGWHIWDLALEPLELMEFLKLFYLGAVFYNSTLVFIKISLLLQYWRLIREVSRYRKVFLAFAAVVVMWSLGILLTLIFICVPVQGYWDKTIPAKCLADKYVQIANAVGNIITDFLLLALPIPIIWKLNLNFERKVALTGIFGLGFFGCIVSLLRAYFVFSIGDAPDLPLAAVATSCWTLAEITTGTICSCLITLQPLVKHWMPNWSSQKRGTGPAPNGPSYKGSSNGRSAQASRSEGRDKPLGIAVSEEQELHGSAVELCPSNNVELSRLPSKISHASRSHPSVSTMADIPLEQFETITANHQRHSAL